VRDVAIQGGEVSFHARVLAPAAQTKVMIHSMASKLVGRLPGVSKVSAKMGGGRRPRRINISTAAGHLRPPRRRAQRPPT